MQPIITNSWAPSHPAANACSCYYGSSPYGSVPTSSWGSEGDQPWSAEDSSLWGSSSPNTIWTDDFYYGPSKPCVGWLCLMGSGGFWGGVSSHVPLQVPRYIGSPFFPPFPSFLQPVFVPLGRRPDPREGPRLAATAVGEGCVGESGSGGLCMSGRVLPLLLARKASQSFHPPRTLQRAWRWRWRTRRCTLRS